MSLVPFTEWLQFSDFQVSHNKDYAVIYSASCQKKVASAETPWECDLHAATVNNQGYVQGDIKGNFKTVHFHKKEPYVFLIRDSAGDSPIYAEVYDIKGRKLRSIKSFDESMLNTLSISKK